MQKKAFNQKFKKKHTHTKLRDSLPRDSSISIHRSNILNQIPNLLALLFPDFDDRNVNVNLGFLILKKSRMHKVNLYATYTSVYTSNSHEYEQEKKNEHTKENANYIQTLLITQI